MSSSPHVPSINHPPSLSAAVLRRNFTALVLDYVLFGIALSILNPTVLPPDFVANLGGGPLLIGLAGLTFRTTWLLPQLFFASKVNRVSHKKRYAAIPALVARFVFIPAGLLMIAAGPDQPAVLILLLLGSIAILGAGDGMTVVAWMDLLGSSLTDRARSRMIGTAQVIMGIIVALAVSPLVRSLLGPDGPAFPDNYAVLLIAVGVLFLLALLALVQVQEGPSPPPKESPSSKQLWRILREDAPFRHYLLVRFFYDLSALGLPFYIVFATTRMGQQSAVALSDQVFLATVSAIVAAIVLSRISERYGTQRVIVLSTAAALLGPLLMLSTGRTSVTGLHLMWLTTGVINSAFVAGFLNWLVEYPPEGYRPLYSGLANTIGAVALLAPLVAGLIVERTSYQTLFTTGAVLGLVALFLALTLPEPRHRQPQTSTEQPAD